MEQPLESVEWGGRDAYLVTPVTVDSSDVGCSINGIRFANCAPSRQPTLEIAAATDLCELQVGAEARYFLACQVGQQIVNEVNNRPPPEHCPGEK